ncbi:MAG: DUF4384 domain-containing protein [Alphaproteobacteria bacterium]|nr:DUF4384 domain-containing protein [Alphaproteobacteria bacterium]
MTRETVQEGRGRRSGKKPFGKSLLLPTCALGALTLLGACGGGGQVTERVVEVPKVVERVVEVEKPRCELRSFDGGRSFNVEAWGLPDANFDVGEPLRLQMRASAAAHVSVYYVSSSCKVTRLLNNRPVKATEIVDFPTPESGLVMTVKPPAGDEAFYFVATRAPVDFLSGGTGGDILGQGAGVASLDMSPDQFYRRLDDMRGRINPDDWSARTLRTRVVGH